MTQPEWCDGSIEACLKCHLTDECVVGVLYSEICLDDDLDKEISGNCADVKRGHSSPEYMRAWKAKNREKVREDFKRYRETHREYFEKYLAQWWKENRDRKRAYDREFYRRHKPEKAKYDRQRYTENHDEILERNRAYRNAHKDEINARRRERRRLKNQPA